MKVSKDILKLSKEIYEENGEREERLRDKCRWEGMTRTQVLVEWPTLFDSIK